ncbi:hypothetical protein JRO89_XS07G0221700 [Xanthoceras sorbifolium]|uniref:Cytochrome P450 n=1 Tax=Xanthoceras sorbifolium TaxID=99658 RepID=A0ABQ8HUJ7_9ROSI|nr:hypothetical protein JRO89_XS07G0221700 [Xanthoceras sorbifolium]
MFDKFNFIVCGDEMEPSFLLVTLLLIIIFVLSALLLVQYSWASPPKALEQIPGSLGWPLLGESFSFLSNFSSPSGIYNFMYQRQQRYGKVFKTFVLGRFSVFMTGREASKILLTGKDGVVRLNLFYTGTQVLGPTSLLQTSGEAHKRLRRKIAEPLSFTLKVIGNMTMSLEPAGEEQEKFRANFKLISSSFASLPLKIPGTAFYRGIKARDRMYAMLNSIIYRRRSGKSFQQDFLESLLIKHSKGTADGEEDSEDKLTDTQLKDNILTLLVAELGLELGGGFAGRTPANSSKQKGRNEPTWSEVNNMPYTAKVINETLRRATVLPWFSRKTSGDFEIDGYKIEEGWSINLDVVSIHHDPEIFPNPHKFDPSRFDAHIKPFSFLGFGSGPRMCPGMNLAKLEISIFIHHLVCRYKWRTLEKDDSVQPTLVRMPRNKYPIVVEPL